MPSSNFDFVVILVFLAVTLVGLHEWHAIPHNGMMRGCKLLCLAIVWIASGNMLAVSGVEACQWHRRIARERWSDEWWRFFKVVLMTII